MCGVCGVFGHKDAASLTYLGLYALQHRGEESTGIVVYDGKKIRQHKAMGLVSDAYNPKALQSLRGHIAVGHTRYSTTGSSTPKNIQPFLVDHRGNHIAIAHNGNLTNTEIVRRDMEEKGSIFQTTMDSEVIAHLIARSSKHEYKNDVLGALGQLQGAFSLVLLVDGMLIGARDPYGFRPLCLGKLNGAYILASETCALDLLRAEYVRDLEPGEVLFISKDGLDSVFLPQKTKRAHCIFEYIYFARPDSNIFGHNVYLARKELGRQLAKECPVDCDIVMPVPDSGSYAAMGFSEASRIPSEIGFIRNHYIGRTFIQPTQSIRDFKVRVKLNPIKDVLKSKRVAIIEDSIVRGTTSRARVSTLREAGAKEVHMRVTCPPIISPCYYGIDFPSKKELIASNHSIEWIRDYIGLDSLQYLSLDGMLASMPRDQNDFCTACFSCQYPTALPKKFSKCMLEKK